MSMETNKLSSFAVFILSHGRPGKVYTYKTLRRGGYTGPIYLILDDEDTAGEEYRARYPGEVITFNKLAAAAITDAGDNFDDRRSPLYARNVVHDVAAALGLDYFLMLDDDYPSIAYKFTSRLRYRERKVLDLDRLFGEVLAFYKSIPALTVAIAQNGDFLGGRNNPYAEKLRLVRKAMNAFFCATARRFQFVGKLNDDVNTYVTLGNRGHLLLTLFNVAVHQKTTQTNTGGLTSLYLDVGTYVKSFYTVMYAPSCVKVHEVGDRHRRIHHRVDWAAAVPCIVEEGYRKRRDPATMGAVSLEQWNEKKEHG